MTTAYYFSAILVGLGTSLPFSPLPLGRALVIRLCLLTMALVGFAIGRWGRNETVVQLIQRWEQRR